MLVLSRKLLESITIGKDIEVKVLKITSSRVTLGVLAPGSVQIKRTEIQEIDDGRTTDNE